MSGISERQKSHLVKWAMFCEPVCYGGLGIRNLRRFNQVLLGKLLWRYGTEREFSLSTPPVYWFFFLNTIFRYLKIKKIKK